MKKLLFILCSFLPIVLFCDKIAVVTATIGKKYSVATFSGVKSKQAYCEKNGYDFYRLCETLDQTRPLAWSKIKAVQQVLKDYDWVFWTDADSVIMNDNVLLEDFIDPNSHFIICYDHCSEDVNSGQFLIKNTDKAMHFLNTVYAKDEYINHILWENRAIMDVIKEPEFGEGFTKILPQRMMNSFVYGIHNENPEACYEPGDFIVHLPGLRNLEHLKSLMDSFFDQSLGK